MENSTAAYFNGSELEEEYAKILEVCTSIYICGCGFYSFAQYVGYILVSVNVQSSASCIDYFIISI